jgi:hypothetical protein
MLLRLNLRRPSPSSNSFAGFVTTVKTIVVEPIDQRSDRGIFPVFKRRAMWLGWAS